MIVSSARVKDMQMRQCFQMGGGFDTFSDLRGSDRLRTLEDVAKAVLGNILMQERYVAYVAVGRMTIENGSLNKAWGKGVHFDNHTETWHMRSSPRGRLNKELLLGEMREIIMLIRDSPASTSGETIHMKLWLHVPDCTSRVRQSSKRGEYTHGAVAVAMTGLHLFSLQGTRVLKKLNNCGGRDDFYCLLSAFTSIKRRPNKEEEAALGIEAQQYSVIESVHTCSTPVTVLAGHIAGTTIHNVHRKLQGIEEVSKEAFAITNLENQSALQRHIADSHFSGPVPVPLVQAYVSKLLSESEELFEQGTFSGMLDMVANAQLTDGALPDDLTFPSRLPLLIVASVRIALTPESYCQPTGRCDDVYAANELGLLFDAVYPRLSSAEANGAPFAVDLVMRSAVAEVMRTIANVQLAGDGQRGGVDCSSMERSMTVTLQTLYRAGCALCHDVCGLPPNPQRRHGTPHTPIMDPFLEGRAQEAAELGMGHSSLHTTAIRSTTRAERQKALLKMFGEVEHWIRTSLYRGRPHKARTTEMSQQAKMVRLCTNAMGSLQVVPDDARAPSGDGERAPGAPAATGRSGPAKKKKSRQAPNKGCTFRHAKVTSEVHQPSHTEATGTIGDIFQLGVCHGTTVCFDFTAFAVGTPYNDEFNTIPCATCNGKAHALLTLGFGGKGRKCLGCKRPRCLTCVQGSFGKKPPITHCQFCSP